MLLSKVWRFQIVNGSRYPNRTPGKFRSDRFGGAKNEGASKRDYSANKFTASIKKQYPGGSNFHSSIRASSSFFVFHHPPNSTNDLQDRSNASYSGLSFIVCGSLLAFLIYELNTKPVKAKEVNQDELAKEYGKFDKRFRTITIEELNKHNCKENGIWVSFREGVYDVTDFVDQHPGGNIIFIAAGEFIEFLELLGLTRSNSIHCIFAGNRLDPFWNIYGNHKTKQVLDLLETFRIANIEPEEISSTTEKSDVYDPFADDPVRNPMLKVHTRKPFNAETPSQLIGKDFLTPNEAFFVRNHLPVPDIDESEYRLELTGLGLNRTYEFTLNDLKQMPQHEVICSIQCAGNRREEFKEYGEVKGRKYLDGHL